MSKKHQIKSQQFLTMTRYGIGIFFSILLIGHGHQLPVASLPTGNGLVLPPYDSGQLSIDEPLDPDLSESSENEEEITDLTYQAHRKKLIIFLSNHPEIFYWHSFFIVFLCFLIGVSCWLILLQLKDYKNQNLIEINSQTLATLNELKNLFVETQNSLFWLQDYLENATIKTSKGRDSSEWSSFSRNIRDSQVFEPDTSSSVIQQPADGLTNRESEPVSLSVRANDLLEQGNALLAQGLYDQAIAVYEQSIALKANSSQAWLHRGCTLFYLKEYEQAIASIDQALHHGGDWPDAWYHRALSLVQLQQWNEAIACYEKATELNPNYLAAWHDRGLTLMSLQRYSEALICFKQVVQLKPNSPEFRVDLGLAFSKLGEYSEAIAAYDRAIDLQPNYALPWREKGGALAALERDAEAIAAYDRALKLNPQDEIVWNYLGIALGKLEQYSEALAAYNQALKLKPNWPMVQNNRAAMLLKLQRYPEAIAACDRAIDLDPDQPAIWYNKACCYGLQGDVDRAIENLQQAIRQNQQIYLPLAKTDADFDPIRQNPRFQQIIQHNELST